MRSVLMGRVNSGAKGRGWGGGREGEQVVSSSVSGDVHDGSGGGGGGDGAVDVTPTRDNVRRTFTLAGPSDETAGGLHQVPSFEEEPSSPPSLMNVSLVSSDASRSSVETGPRPLSSSAVVTPPRNTTRSNEGEEDHPLSPRYLSYRSSLASRLIATTPTSTTSTAPPASPVASAKTVYVSTFSPRTDLEVITSSPLGTRSSPRSAKHVTTTPSDEDRERRIAEAMLVSDDDETDDDDDSRGPGGLVPGESVRERLHKRLERNQAVRPGTSSAPATSAGTAAVAMNSGGGGPSNDADESSAAAAAAGAVAAAALTGLSSDASHSTASTPLREFTVHNVNENRNSMTPRSMYSTTSSITDPNLNLSTFSNLSVTPGATPDRWNAATMALEEAADPILSPVMKSKGGTPDAHPDDEDSLLGVARSLGDMGGDGDKSPMCLSPRSNSTSQPSRSRSYMWLLLGGGALLLLTAVALALAFLLTNRAGASQPASSTSADNRTTPEEGDPDWSALYPSLYPARQPSASGATPTDDAYASSRVPVPTPLPALRRPTAPPSEAPSPPPTYSPQNQELLNMLTSTYADRFGTNPADVQAYLEEKGTPQQRAFQWLMAAHGAPQRLILGEDRLIQRYALATFYYATNGTVLDRVGDDDTYYQYSPGSWLNSDDECKWLPGICRQGFVTNIKLKGVGLIGTIPAELALLSGLEELNLSENNLHGSLPTELGVLSELQRLNLRVNRITGTFPVQYESLENVEIIRFDSNQLSGTVPQQVCKSFFSNFTVNATQSHPHLYLDCGGSNPEISCPPGICCTYCCVGNNCDCVFANTALEYDLC